MRIYTIVILLFLCFVNAHFKHISTHHSQKCFPGDPRHQFAKCALDYRDMTLWCDATNFTLLPHPEDIKSQAPSSKSSVLYMNSSCLAYLDPEVFNSYTRLEIASFADNMINNVTNGTLLHQPRLKKLYLSSNQISSIDSAAFTGATYLEVFNLRKNQISEISPTLFSSLKNLKELLLDWNQLEVADLNWFQSSPHLQVLSFSHNSIKKWIVLKQTSDNLLEKHSLDSSKTFSRHRQTTGTLRVLSKLRHLSLKGNKLTHIPDNAFDGTPSLAMLDLQDNLIEYLPEATLKNLCYLRKLFISGNRLTVISPRWVINVLRNNEHSDLTTNHSITALDNKWNCDCNIKPYWNLLKSLEASLPGSTSGIHKLFDVECSYPSIFSERRLSSLTSKELCEEELLDDNKDAYSTSIKDLLHLYITRKCKKASIRSRRKVASRSKMSPKNISSGAAVQMMSETEMTSSVSSFNIILFVVAVVVACVILTVVVAFTLRHLKRKTNAFHRKSTKYKTDQRTESPICNGNKSLTINPSKSRA